MKLKPHIQWSPTPGSGYLFDPQTGSLFALNRTAHLVLQAMEHCNSRNQIVDHMLAAHPDSQAAGGPSLSMVALADDLAAFLQLLQDQDLIHYR
jgi:hypothetical protein